MSIRKATPDDYGEIKDLLDELGYPGTADFLQGRIECIVNHPDADLYVYETEKNIVAFIALNYILQLALPGDFALISYFAVHHSWHRKGIGKEMEAFCVELARQRNCDRIEVHCQERRKEAHWFYIRRGYRESPKYFVKSLI